MKRIFTLVTALLVITVVAPAHALKVSITEDDPTVCASPVLIGREIPKIESGSSPKHQVSYSPKSVVGKHSQAFQTSKEIDLSGKPWMESDGTTCPGQVHSVIPKVPPKLK